MKSKAMNYITWKVNFSELRYPKVKPKRTAYEAFLDVISLVLSFLPITIYAFDEFENDTHAIKLHKPSFFVSTVLQ